MSDTDSSKVHSPNTNPPSLFTPPPPYTECHDSRPTDVVRPRAHCNSDSNSDSIPPSPSSIESLDVMDQTAWRQMQRRERRRLRYNDPRRLTWKSNKPEIVAIVTFFFIFISFLLAIAYLGVRSYPEYEAFRECVKRGGGMEC